jgi:cohesin complex subunit SA-1/2
VFLYINRVFVHRYRDVDAAIRAECIKELCVWIKSYPSTFLEDSYTRYIGWLLSDIHHTLRLEALKAYITLNSLPNIKSSLLSFTLRFKPRLLEIALKDTEPSLRLVALTTLSPAILEDDESFAVLQSIAKGARCEKFVIEMVKDVMDTEGLQGVLRTLESVGATEASSQSARSKVDLLVDNAWECDLLHVGSP